MSGIKQKLFSASTVYLFLAALIICSTPSLALKARWIPNGKKPAPFSKKYRDEHGIKSGEGTYGEPDPPPSNVKMLIFFAACIGLWWYFTRKKNSARVGGGSTLGSRPVVSASSRASASAASPSRAQTPSDAASMREARLRALQNRQKNMDAALAAAGQSGSGSSMGSSSGSSTVRQRKGGVHGLHTIVRGETEDDKAKGNSRVTDATADDRARLIFPDDVKED